ncbi:MAG: winged helix-turn-helix transcriptional regulator [Candidatus Heimdallarchaeota archaeon]|nr:winged helix-turn-helix transcriptional regulator [Candidatus Heimdallarchaeota archaeon]
MANISEKEEIQKLLIEDVLSSRGRVRILKLLAELDELNVSAISRNINLNHSAVKQHLKFLCKAGLIREKKFGRILIYQYDNENILSSSLKQLFAVWEEKKQ